MIIYKTILCSDNKDSRHQCAHSLLRDMLQNYTSHNYSEIKLDANGKPYIEGVAFSISHSKELSVICMCVDNTITGDFVKVSDADAFSIGVDVEVISGKDRVRCSKIAKIKFSDKENEYLNESDNDDEYIRRFAMCWTHKESYGKFTGVGLKDALRFDTSDTHSDICLYSSVFTAGDSEYALSIVYNSKSEI